jgi:hypothetical protein
MVAVVGVCGCRTLPGDPLDGLAPFEASDEALVSRARDTVLNAFPETYRAVHRAVITVGRRQFACDGVMTVSAEEGWQLAIVNTLGLVSQVRVNGRGEGEVLKVTPLFREEWSRDFVIRDVHWLFVPPNQLQSQGRREDGALVLEIPVGEQGLLARYVVSPDGERWTELELYRDGRRIYRAVMTAFQKDSKRVAMTPLEIHVTTEPYELHLRVVRMIPMAEHRQSGGAP